MKAFLYKMKGALALALAMALFTPQVFAAPLSATEQGVQPAPEKPAEEIAPLPQLTFDEALAKVKKNSVDLKDLDATVEMLWEVENDLEDMGIHRVPTYDYKKWVPDMWYAATAGLFSAEMGQKQAKLGKEMTELGLEAGVKGTFIGIIANESALALQEQNAEVQQTLFNQGYAKYRLGLLSKYNLDQLQIAAQQAKDAVEKQKLTLDQAYIKFNHMMGVDADQRYEYIYDVSFAPYELPSDMNVYINAEMKKDLSIALKELELEQAKFNQNYRPESDDGSKSEQLKLSNEQAKRALKAAKQEKEMLIRNAALDIKDAETTYMSAQSDLSKAQANYRVAQVNFQAGNVTKMTVDQAYLGVLQAELALQADVYNHDMMVFMFENPSLLSNTGK